MSTPWPSTLPQAPAVFSEKQRPVVARTNPDDGPSKVRRRFTRAIHMATFEYMFTKAEYATFRDFFGIDMDSGVNQFTQPHPWTGTTTTWMNMSEPSISSDGPLGVRVSFTADRFA